MLTSRVSLSLNANKSSKKILKKLQTSKIVQVNILNDKENVDNDNDNTNILTLHPNRIKNQSSSSSSFISSSDSDSDSNSSSELTFNKKSPTQSKDYKEYGLSKTESSPASKSEILHCYLPKLYKDDESYKIKLFKFLRKPQNKNCKTDSCNLAQYLRSRSSFDGNISKLDDIWCKGKFKKVISCKKKYASEIEFKDNNKRKNYFRFYMDNDIGFPMKWQAQIHIAEMDDDVNTDDEQLEYAGIHCLKELVEGIRLFAKNKKSSRCYRMYHSK